MRWKLCPDAKEPRDSSPSLHMSAPVAEPTISRSDTLNAEIASARAAGAEYGDYLPSLRRSGGLAGKIGVDDERL